MKRFQARRRGGRFTRNTPENTLGLHIIVCTSCRTLNAWPTGEARPTACHACKASLPEDAPACRCDAATPVPAFIDPAKFRVGLICNACHRELKG